MLKLPSTIILSDRFKDEAEPQTADTSHFIKRELQSLIQRILDQAMRPEWNGYMHVMIEPANGEWKDTAQMVLSCDPPYWKIVIDKTMPFLEKLSSFSQGQTFTVMTIPQNRSIHIDYQPEDMLQSLMKFAEENPTAGSKMLPYLHRLSHVTERFMHAPGLKLH